MPQQAGDVLLITFDGLWHNQRTMTTFHYGVGTLVGTPSYLDFATAVRTAFLTAGGLIPTFLAACPEEYFLNNLWVQTIKPVRVVKTILSVASSGTNEFHSSTANLSTVVTRRGPLANRKNIGSVHVPFANLDADSSNGTISESLLTILNTFGVQVRRTITMVGVGSITPVLYNGPTAADVSPIESTISQLTIRTMRRRTVGRGI